MYLRVLIVRADSSYLMYMFWFRRHGPTGNPPGILWYEQRLHIFCLPGIYRQSFFRHHTYVCTVFVVVLVSLLWSGHGLMVCLLPQASPVAATSTRSCAQGVLSCTTHPYPIPPSMRSKLKTWHTINNQRSQHQSLHILQVTQVARPMCPFGREFIKYLIAIPAPDNCSCPYYVQERKVAVLERVLGTLM